MSTFNLQEAYYQVYEQEQLDEISVETIKSASDQAGRLAGQAAALGAPDYAKKKRKQQERLYAAQAKKRLKTKTAKITREETDLFDYVLEYLVSEGYADTNENALVIMANMSEEWRESILEEGYKKFPKGKVDKKMASKVVKAAKHQVAATWGDKNKSSENQEKANKLGSQAKHMAQISTEKNKEANSWKRGVQSKHKSEVKRKIRYMDDIAKQKKKEYEERETEMKKKMRRELGGG